jgi:hypothetical protein
MAPPALILALGTLGLAQEPVWQTSDLYERYGREDRVLRPWTPVEADGRRLSVWGRDLLWRRGSLLPSSLTSGGIELLAEPIQLCLELDGEVQAVPLADFRVTERKRSRVAAIATGEVRGIRASAEMWLEYDGFLWVTLTLADEHADREVDSLRLRCAMPAGQATLYQTFSRRHAGWIGNEPVDLPWMASAQERIANFYHWVGTEDRGLGFTYTSLEHWAPTSEEAFCTIRREGERVVYTANLIGQPSPVTGRVFRLGLQATPIKPLPPDYHSMASTGLDWHEWAAWQGMTGDVDSVVIWPPGHMRGLNDPYNLNAEALQQQIAYIHERGTAALFTGCPQKISPLSQEFEAHRADWLVEPESVLDWEGTPHYQNCGGSEVLLKWLFYGWGPGIVERFGLEGIYYDGWQTGQIACRNARHGCGWTDAQGERHVTVPVLQGRAYNQRMAAFLEDRVTSRLGVPETAPERADFPQYHYRLHSWEFVPSVMGFATSWLTGEFAAYPLEGLGTLEPEGTFGRCLGLGLFRSRCLSTNWGVPNLFHPVMWEHTENHPTDRQTLMAYAWFLPHGVPVGELRYMNQATLKDLYRVLHEYEVRQATFVPGWRPNPYLRIEGAPPPEVMVATWSHPGERRVLAVVSNLQADRTEAVRVRWTGAWEPLVRDARTGDAVRVEEGVVTVQLGPEAFVLLGIDGGD